MNGMGFDEIKEKDQCIAFLVVAHADAPHLRRLCKVLSPHRVFVHWDKKSGAVPDIPGATFIKERVPVYWAGFSQVAATISLIREAVGSGESFSKVVLISGSCYPIKPVSELAKIFRRDGQRNYIKAVAVNDSLHLKNLVARRVWRDAILPHSLGRGRLISQTERVLRFSLNTFLRILPKPFPPEELFHGSQWWALSMDACQHILKVYDERPDLVSFYRYTFASDEQFFHTIVMNSPFADNSDGRQAFIERGTWRTANFHLVDPSLTKWFGAEDVDLIRNSDKFFVRKLRSGVSDTLVDWIDANLLETPTRVDHPAPSAGAES